MPLIKTITAAFALCLLAAPLAAQTGGGAGEATDQTPGVLGSIQGEEPKFDPSTIETVRGEVTAVSSFQAQVGLMQSVRMQVRTEEETLPVILAPSSYLETQNTKIHKGDQVEITGSRVSDNNAPLLIATQVKKGNQILRLRHSNGKPMWTSGE